MMGAEDFVLYGVTFVDTFDFCSEILEGGGNLGRVLCHSIDAG